MALSLDGTTGISASGNITGNNVIASGSLIVGSFAPSSLNTVGNVTGGNLTTAGLITATGNITGGNLRTAGLVSATGSITAGGDLSLIGNIVDTGPLSLITSANSNITLAPNGTGVVIVNTDIRNGQSSGVGNIGASGATFNTIFAKATSAQYADLAEMYQADQQLDAGQVVEFGGAHEIQKSTSSHSTRVAGIVSTNPSYLMNSAMDVPHKAPVALTGRVPCYVVGKISKGDRLVASDFSGVATVLDMDLYQPGCIIGKALEDYDSQDIGKIEVAVGRF
jgi:hypothetical protein